jgi:hypothetical protein
MPDFVELAVRHADPERLERLRPDKIPQCFGIHGDASKGKRWEKGDSHQLSSNGGCHLFQVVCR